ncbi:MAG TPA: hypothetical protein VH092_23565 [Urbifossiella sp.]|jgi:hypothetical protein|nr:hypothetical protein [Urbifossiella sp.]
MTNQPSEVIIQIGGEILDPNPGSYTVAISRAEWDALDEKGREARLDKMAEERVAEIVGTWATVVDNPTDEDITGAVR